MQTRLYFFFNDTATTEIYTLSLHDALPIFIARSEATWQSWSLGSNNRLARRLPLSLRGAQRRGNPGARALPCHRSRGDRKSTRLNSSHANISYAVFCLKKKNIPHLLPFHCL